MGTRIGGNRLGELRSTLSLIGERHSALTQVTFHNGCLGLFAIRPTVQRHLRINGDERLEFCGHLHVEILVFGHRERVGRRLAGICRSVRSGNLHRRTRVNVDSSAGSLHGSAVQRRHSRQVLYRQVIARRRGYRQRTYPVRYRGSHRSCCGRWLNHCCHSLLCPCSEAGQQQQGGNGQEFIHIMFHIAHVYLIYY